jgi:Flp pilus assembly protein TadD
MTATHSRSRQIVSAILRAAGVSAGVLIMGWAAITSAGCSGRGDFTQAHLSGAREKMDALKAGTEWQMAHQAFLSGDMDKALRHISFSLDLNPKVARSHILRGRIMLEMGNIEQASASFKEAQTIDPKTVEAPYYQGILAERLGRTQEALTLYLQANELDPSAPQYVLAASEMMIDLGELDRADAFLREHRENFENNAGLRQTLGHIAMIRGQPEQAIELFHEARLLAPDDGAILEDLVRAQIATGRFAQAETNLARLLSNEENASRRDLMHMRVQCLLQLRRPVDARNVLLTLTTGNEGAADLEAWMALGKVAFELRDQSRLRDAAARVISLAPERPEGFVLRALNQRRAGQLGQARENLITALSKQMDVSTLLLLGSVCQDMDRTDEARRAFARALELDPSSVEARSLLASIDAPASASRTAGASEPQD